MEKLTVKEAIEQGYTHYGYTSFEGKLFHLSDIDQDKEFGTDENGECFLYAPGERHPSVDAKNIEQDILNDTIVNCEVDDMDDSIEIAFKKAGIDWEAIADKINKELDGVTYYEGTNIKLVPDAA